MLLSTSNLYIFSTLIEEKWDKNVLVKKSDAVVNWGYQNYALIFTLSFT